MKRSVYQIHLFPGQFHTQPKDPGLYRCKPPLEWKQDSNHWSFSYKGFFPKLMLKIDPNLLDCQTFCLHWEIRNLLYYQKKKSS